MLLAGVASEVPPSPFSFEVFQSGVPGRRPVIDIVQISLPSIFVLGISWFECIFELQSRSEVWASICLLNQTCIVDGNHWLFNEVFVLIFMGSNVQIGGFNNGQYDILCRL
ncbi:uncharacterized protein LOC122045292 isoform X1 [Zingiber officinale]|uniref:uncharacterized protein LOC122045292 isoform X1 n=1 Tax=Zingiber officinale TaxID=94328 RepID=UPI001C4B21BF|nr:uncharacterized protein LOC122045292 isoform X1 [Zingiber officinale]